MQMNLFNLTATSRMQHDDIFEAEYNGFEFSFSKLSYQG